MIATLKGPPPSAGCSGVEDVRIRSGSGRRDDVDKCLTTDDDLSIGPIPCVSRAQSAIRSSSTAVDSIAMQELPAGPDAVLLDFTDEATPLIPRSWRPSALRGAVATDFWPAPRTWFRVRRQFWCRAVPVVASTYSESIASYEQQQVDQPRRRRRTPCRNSGALRRRKTSTTPPQHSA